MSYSIVKPDVHRWGLEFEAGVAPRRVTLRFQLAAFFALSCPSFGLQTFRGVRDP